MKRALGIATAVVFGVLLLGIGAVLLLVKPDRIKEDLLARIRAQSGYALEAGDASLALGWSGAGIRVRDVRASAPDSSIEFSLVSVSAYLRILPLLKRRVELERLDLERPDVILRSKPGETGAPDPAANPAAALGFLGVNAWSIRDGRYRQAGPWGEMSLEDLDLEGSFTWEEREGGRGEAGGSAAGGVFRTPAGSFPVPGLRTGLRFAVAPAMDSLRIEEMGIGSGEVQAAFVGGYSRVGASWAGELVGRVDPVAWKELAPLLPPAMSDSLRRFTIDGTVSMPELRIRTEPPGPASIRGEVRLEAMSVKAQGAPAGLEEFGGRLLFSRESMTLLDGRGSVAGAPLTVEARVTGTGPREASVHVTTSLPGATLGSLLPAGAPLRLSGGSVLVDVTANAAIPGPRVPGVTGHIALDGLSGSFRDLPVRSGRGNIRFTGRGAEITGLGAEVGKSDFVLDATVPELSDPWATMRIRSGTLDLDELAPPEDEGGKEAGASGPAIGLPGEGTLEIGTLRTRGVEVRNVRSKLRVDRDGLRLEDLRGKVYEGDVSGSLALRPEAGAGTWRYEGTLGARGVRVGTALAPWFPPAEFLEGTVEGSMDLNGRAGGAIDPRRALTMIGEIRLAEGAFREVGFLSSLRQFLEIPEADGSRWPFRSLATHFVFRDGALEVEGLKLTQAGMDWQLGGRIGVDGTLAMSGTLRADPDRLRLPAAIDFLKPYLAEADGRVPLDFKLDGPATGPRVTLDWDALGQRAMQRAKSQESEKLDQKIQETIKDPETLQKLKNLLGGKKGGGE